MQQCSNAASNSKYWNDFIKLLLLKAGQGFNDLSLPCQGKVWWPSGFIHIIDQMFGQFMAFPNHLERITSRNSIRFYSHTNHKIAFKQMDILLLSYSNHIKRRIPRQCWTNDGIWYNKYIWINYLCTVFIRTHSSCLFSLTAIQTWLHTVPTGQNCWNDDWLTPWLERVYCFWACAKVQYMRSRTWHIIYKNVFTN